jgi:hypothetical protein
VRPPWKSCVAPSARSTSTRRRTSAHPAKRPLRHRSVAPAIGAMRGWPNGSLTCRTFSTHQDPVVAEQCATGSTCERSDALRLGELAIERRRAAQFPAV